MSRVLIAHPSADVYGSDRQLLESAHGLRDTGWSITIVLPYSGPLLAALSGYDVRFLRFSVLRKALLTPRGLASLALTSVRDLVRVIRVLRQVRPDLVYVNTVTIPIWTLAGWLLHIPVLVHVHEAEVDTPRAVCIALNAPLLLATRVVANSAASRDVVVAAVPLLARRAEVIPNGVPDHGATSYDCAEPNRLVVVARLSPRKGVDVALEAIARLRADGRDITLDVCGSVFDGYEWFEDELRARAAEPDLAGAVHFHGYVDDTTRVLAAAAVVLVPSRVEPFGNTAVEGLLAGRPVVASRVQGLAEIIEDGRTGLLVAPGDPHELARAVGGLLDTPARAAEIGICGRAAARSRFSTAGYRASIVAVGERIARVDRPIR